MSAAFSLCSADRGPVRRLEAPRRLPESDPSLSAKDGKVVAVGEDSILYTFESFEGIVELLEWVAEVLVDEAVFLLVGEEMCARWETLLSLPGSVPND